MSFTHVHGVANLIVGVIDIDVLSEYVSWYYKSLCYDLRLQMEGFPFLVDRDLMMILGMIRMQARWTTIKVVIPLIRMIEPVRW